MKKLLTLFGSLGLVASTAVVSVACKTPSQKMTANESDKAKEKEKLTSLASSAIKKETKKVKSHEEAASDLTGELFVTWDNLNKFENVKTETPTEILKRKQNEIAEKSVSLSSAPRTIDNSKHDISGWLGFFK
ncbi:lipoprotein [Mycoplasma capricolum]|uniref:Lipoprotein n=1 Tax=Mycoplasma capricolum subsp. capricolum TaxID=40479 RepID=A0A0C3A1B5_MYCCA|nr:lipoprotein [Mycoplasma capricolum]KIM14064.1 lipoprotein [Mycoplasma capricolum subsp. capricolum]